MGAVAGDAMRMVAEVDERGDIAVGFEPDIASASAVAAVGTTQRHMGLAPD